MADKPDIQQAKLQDAVNTMMDELEWEKLRPMQKASFLAMAKCCDRPSRNEAQQCFANSSVPVQRAEAMVKQEMDSFQQRLQRCVQGCQDQVKDRMPNNLTPETAQNNPALQKLEGELNKCAVACMVDMQKLLPNIKNRILSSK